MYLVFFVCVYTFYKIASKGKMKDQKCSIRTAESEAFIISENVLNTDLYL
jgi:hypothetical protein